MRLGPLALPLALLPASAVACASQAAPEPGAASAVHQFVDRDGLPFLQARIGEGEPMPFLLDTGASPCVLDSAVAQTAGIKTGPVVERQGGAGTFTSRAAAEPVTLRVGQSLLTCSETLVADLSGLTEVSSGPVAGIIGGDFFRGRIVEIDFERDLVSTFDRARHNPAGTRIPIRIERNLPYVTARLSVANGPQDVERELLIDTGSRDGVDDALLAQSADQGAQVASAGLGSGHRARTGRFNRVEIGPHRLKDVDGVVPSVAIVGAGLLARYRLIFDYDGGWVILDDQHD